MLLLISSGCKNPFTPRLDKVEQYGEETPDNWLPLNSHTNVIKNFLYVYNYQEAPDLTVEFAIAYYESLFVGKSEPLYQYKYEVKDKTDPDKVVVFYGIDEELATNGRLFRNVDQLGLSLNLTLKQIDGYTIERAEESAEHPGEDWYLYRYDTTLIMDNPNGGFPYRVQGEVVFKIRRCADGLYRIVNWIDWTYLPPEANARTAAGRMAP